MSSSSNPPTNKPSHPASSTLTPIPRKRILISSGGTGGHVFPSIALAQKLSSIQNNCEVLFVGGGLSKNKYFNQSANHPSYPYNEISCGSFVSRNPLNLLRSLGRILKGIYESHKLIRQFKPDAVVSFGSYYTFPTLIAATFSRVPLVLYAADSIPGRVVRFIAPYASVTGIHFPSTAQHIKGKTIEAGLPLRTGYTIGSISRSEAAAYFELNPEWLTMLVFGGSQGARSLNHLVPDALISLAKQNMPFQVIHLTGNKDLTIQLQKKYADAGITSCVKEFETKMNYAWAATDFALSRSGAATIAEAIAFEVPAYLVPYPTAMDNHQEYNAQFLEKIGGAVLRLENNLTAENITDDLANLLKDDQRIIKQMKQKIKDFKIKTPQRELAEVVMEAAK